MDVSTELVEVPRQVQCSASRRRGKVLTVLPDCIPLEAGVQEVRIVKEARDLPQRRDAYVTARVRGRSGDNTAHAVDEGRESRLMPDYAVAVARVVGPRYIDEGIE